MMTQRSFRFGGMRRCGTASGFSLVELLAAIAIVLVLAAGATAAWRAAVFQADRADAAAKIRIMGIAVLQYAHDHGGMLPPLFPGQVLEYEEGRGGRIVTECAGYLDLPLVPGRHLAASLMPRAYTRMRSSPDPASMRVYVMNAAITTGRGSVAPFGSVVTAGQPPVGPATLAQIGDHAGMWMMSTADQQQPNVAGSPWKGSTPPEPPLGGMRAIFHFDGSVILEKIR